MKQKNSAYKIWIIQVGEPTPNYKTPNVRLFRSGQLAKKLKQRGHDVTWWTSNFNHATKQKIWNDDKVIYYHDGIKYIYLRGVNYHKNVSILRVINHLQLAIHFLRIYSDQDRPDIIISNYPTVDLSFITAFIANRKKIPYIIDVRDLWPDDIVNLFSKPLQNLVKSLLVGYYLAVRYIFNNTKYITGVTKKYVDWTDSKHKSAHMVTKRVFHLCCDEQTVEQMLIEKKIDDIANKRICFVFSGMLGISVDLEKIFKVFNLLEQRGWIVSVDICGAGDQLEKYRSIFVDENKYHFHGFLDSHKLNNIIKKATFGIIPYFVTGSLNSNIPNKVGEYLNHSLPIINSLKGETENLVKKYNIGINYLDSQPSSIDNAMQYFSNFNINPNNYKVQSDHAKKCYNELFNSNKVYNDYCNWVESIINND
ncbi:glycosyltransferase family 4 protein [Verrucomicrobia bacterium]|nr:glycosyltransferase family 4 protein [Verrucomicrobiota bacterium]